MPIDDDDFYRAADKDSVEKGEKRGTLKGDKTEGKVAVRINKYTIVYKDPSKVKDSDELV